MNLSTIKPFILQSEAVRGNGENAAFAHSFESGLVVTGVFDGCGNIGNRRYSGANDRTGAYIGSRIAAFAASEYFEQNFSKKGSSYIRRTSTEQLEYVRQLKEHISGKLDEVKKRLSRPDEEACTELPTGVSITASMSAGNFTLCNYIWAGNTRGYMLDDQGLCQLTTDDTDINSDDAFAHLRKRGKITNYAGGTGDFRLHSGFTVFSRPVIMINASEECFTHFRTPMEFENVILQTMTEASSPSRWMARLGEILKKITGSDCTIAFACYGFEDFEDMKKYYTMRQIRIRKESIDLHRGADEKILKQLWEQYRSSYYRSKLKTKY